jgi:hypothetical protein
MSIEQTIFSTLSPVCAGRVYPDIGAQSERNQHIVYTLVFESGIDHLSGDPGLRNSRYQFDCWSDTKSGAVALAESARAALRNLTSVFIGRNPSDYDPETKLYRESMDFSIWH